MALPNIWAQQDFGVTPSILEGRYPAQFLTNDSSPSSQQTTVATIMALAKEDLRKELKKYLDNAYPNTITSLKNRILSYREGRFDNNAPLSYRGIVNQSGEFIDDDEFANGVFFYWEDIPTSDTYSDQADNGRYLITRIGSYDYLYINRGTKAVPSWQPIGEITDYITNPNELYESYILACKYHSFQHRRDGSVVNNFLDTAAYFELCKEHKKEYDRELCRIAPFIIPNVSNDSALISDFAMSSVKEPQGWF